MPEYRIAETVLDLARNAILIDTGVLVAAFFEGEDEGNQYTAKTLLAEGGYPLLVPTAVVVEAWGWLVGSRNATAAGYELLNWLNTPGRATVIPPHRPDLFVTQQLIRRLRVDFVDATLADLATSMTDCCSLSPYMPIATFDTGDFTRMFAEKTLRLRIFDMKAFDFVYM